VLPFIYPGKNVQQLLGNIETADIPDQHKKMFAWIREFTLNSANLTGANIESLVQAGIPYKDIVEWANVASTQTWFVMSADGGGIPLEGNAVVGSVLGLDREQYHHSEVDTACKSISPEAHTDTSWVATDENNVSSIADWANDRYEFVPNLFRALSLAPHYYPRHQLALQLLDAPQSGSLSPRLHAMVRRLANRRNAGEYFNHTTLELVSGYEQVVAQAIDGNFNSLDPVDRTVLQFADKLARHAYKVTEKDAQGFRDCGLDDEAYVDVLNTVSIQTSLDRLCSSLGIQADDKPLLADRSLHLQARSA
jgi:alkylhydroperoxidase family enzyme